MPQFKNGDMWSDYPTADLFCVTTNSYIKWNRELVMGRGIAVQARDRFPGLAFRLGDAIGRKCGHLGNYGLMLDLQTHIAAFQVKYRWYDNASPFLIRESVAQLITFLNGRPLAVHLNFPGIGNGHLTRADVLPLLMPLPSNVTIWERGA